MQLEPEQLVPEGASNLSCTRHSGMEADPITPHMRERSSDAALESWCKSMELADEIFQRLRSERVRNPEHLVHLEKADLACFVDGLKLGEKGCFYHAVHLLKVAQGFVEWDSLLDG